MVTDPWMNDGHLSDKVTDPGMNDGHLYGECAPYVSLGNGEGEDGAFARLEAHNLRPASVSCVKFNIKTKLNVFFTCNKNKEKKMTPLDKFPRHCSAV
jgi:hypothetical protein